MLVSRLRLGLSTGTFPLGFSTNTLYAFLAMPLRIASHSRLIFLYRTIQMKCLRYKLWSYLVRGT